MQPRASVVGPLVLRRLRRLCLSAVLMLACSSGKATSDELHDFNDGKGRACRAKLAKTSPTSPPVSESVSCDGDPKQCSPESKPCFELNVAPDTFEIVNCPACCRGSASSFVSADCSAVLCASDADCVYRQAKCIEGACSCPNGNCD